MLKELRDFVNTHGWCQGPCATNAEGERTFVDSDDAVNFCLYGAMNRLWSGSLANALANKVGFFIDPTADDSFRVTINFNEAEGRTKQDIINLLDIMIGAEEKACSVA